jgi:nitrogen-specific signal transduction histidine kinase
MDILEKLENNLNEKVSTKEITKLTNNITKSMDKLTSLVNKSDAFPDQKKTFQQQMNIVWDNWLKAFDTLSDIMVEL